MAYKIKTKTTHDRMTWEATNSKGFTFKVAASRSGFRYSGTGTSDATFAKQQKAASKLLNSPKGTLETKFKKLKNVIKF